MPYCLVQKLKWPEFIYAFGFLTYLFAKYFWKKKKRDLFVSLVWIIKLLKLLLCTAFEKYLSDSVYNIYLLTVLTHGNLYENCPVLKIDLYVLHKSFYSVRYCCVWKAYVLHKRWWKFCDKVKSWKIKGKKKCEGAKCSNLHCSKVKVRSPCICSESVKIMSWTRIRLISSVTLRDGCKSCF